MHEAKRRTVGSRRCLRAQRGQSILEYLLIVTLIVIAFVTIKPTVQTHLNTLYGHARNKVGTAASSFGADLKETIPAGGTS